MVSVGQRISLTMQSSAKKGRPVDGQRRRIIKAKGGHCRMRLHDWAKGSAPVAAVALPAALLPPGIAAGSPANRGGGWALRASRLLACARGGSVCQGDVPTGLLELWSRPSVRLRQPSCQPPTRPLLPAALPAPIGCARAAAKTSPRSRVASPARWAHCKERASGGAL